MEVYLVVIVRLRSELRGDSHQGRPSQYLSIMLVYWSEHDANSTVFEGSSTHLPDRALQSPAEEVEFATRST